MADKFINCRRWKLGNQIRSTVECIDFSIIALRVWSADFKDNQRRLVNRREKECISLELSIDNAKIFRDVRPVVTELISVNS